MYSAKIDAPCNQASDEFPEDESSQGIAYYDGTGPEQSAIPITPLNTTVLVRSAIPRMPRAPPERQKMLKTNAFHHVNRCPPPVFRKLRNAATKYTTPRTRSGQTVRMRCKFSPRRISIYGRLNRTMVSQDDIVAAMMRLKTFRDSEAIHPQATIRIKRVLMSFIGTVRGRGRWNATLYGTATSIRKSPSQRT